jgi:hypothetical protein
MSHLHKPKHQFESGGQFSNRTNPPSFSAIWMAFTPSFLAAEPNAFTAALVRRALPSDSCDRLFGRSRRNGRSCHDPRISRSRRGSKG